MAVSDINREITQSLSDMEHSGSNHDMEMKDAGISSSTAQSHRNTAMAVSNIDWEITQSLSEMELSGSKHDMEKGMKDDVGCVAGSGSNEAVQNRPCVERRVTFTSHDSTGMYMEWPTMEKELAERGEVKDYGAGGVIGNIVDRLEKLEQHAQYEAMNGWRPHEY